jgi:hypothetical protein
LNTGRQVTGTGETVMTRMPFQIMTDMTNRESAETFPG